MIFPSGERRRTAARLYSAAVAAARAPAFYRDLGVADTIEGRYELIVLHVVLVLRRIAGPGHARLSQALVDIMAADLDRSIREIGIGDLSVGKYMKRLGEGFYGRAQAYNAALGAAPTDLATVILRNVYAGVDPDERRLALMTDYIHIQDQHLARHDISLIAAGSIDLLAPPGFDQREQSLDR